MNYSETQENQTGKKGGRREGGRGRGRGGAAPATELKT